MRILLTGGAGFIGSSVAEALLLNGHELIVIDNFDPFYDRAIKEQNCASFRNKVTFIEGDVANENVVNQLEELPKPELILHLASKAGVRPSIQNPTSYFRANVDSTIHLLNYAHKNGILKFILASSSSVYGINEKIPFSESDTIQQSISPYAASKIAAEQIGHTYAHIFGISVTVLRFFTVYGPRQRPDLAIHKFARMILNDEPIPVYGDGTTARDYTYIDDIVQGVLGAVTFTGKDRYQVFNLGESKVIALQQLISELEKQLGKKAVINRMPEQPGDVPVTYADISKAKKWLGYNPKVDLSEGISNFVKWLKAHN